MLIHDLEIARDRAKTILGSHYGYKALADYHKWAVEQTRMLRGQISAVDLDRLVLTRRYWSLQSANTEAIPEQLVTALIQEELEERVEDFEVAIKELKTAMGRWGNDNAVVVALDTSVLLELGADFSAHKWHSLMNERPDVHLYLVVTMAAVDELDSKKRSRDNSEQGQRIRSQAHATLRNLEQTFWDTTMAIPLQWDGIPTRKASLVLLTDEPDHVRLDDMDSEIIDRTASIEPFVTRMVTLTYDVGMVFRSRAAGFEAVRLEYPPDPKKPVRQPKGQASKQGSAEQES